MFIDYVNVLFSSNSQLVVAGRTPFHWKCCTFENRAVKICTHRTCRAEVGIGEIGTGEVSAPEIGFVEILAIEDSPVEFFALREGEDYVAVYVLNLNHLVLFFDAKVRFFSDSAKFIFQGVER